MAERKSRKNRLRKQPRMRRMESATAVPSMQQLPQTARKRRRRARRQQRRQRLPLTTLKSILFSARWVSLGLLSLCIYALYMIGMTERFYLTMIPVEGAISVLPSEVVQQSGLGGVHIFAADPGRAAVQITDIPGVTAAAVTLNWPNQASIQIEEDSPIAVWIEGSRQYWITENGRLIPARSGTLGLLLIESEMPLDTAVEPAASDETSETAAETAVTETTAAAQMAFVPQPVLEGAMQLRTLRPNIERLYYRPSTGLSYQDGRGWRVYFGDGHDMHQKLVVYEAIVADLLDRGLTPAYISVSNQEAPFYRVQ